MVVATLAQLNANPAEYLEIVRGGGRVVITDDGEAVAELVAVRRATLQESKLEDQIATQIEELVAQGRLRPPFKKLPDDFLTRPKPTFSSGSVLDALLEERRESRW